MRSSWRVHSSTNCENGRWGGGCVWASAPAVPASKSPMKIRRKSPRMRVSVTCRSAGCRPRPGSARRGTLTAPGRHGILRLKRVAFGGKQDMAGGSGAVGEVRVKPDRLHAFTMAICRADGSSEQEARLVADHLVLANLFGHDSHGVGMMPHYIQNTTTGRCVRNHHAKI